MTAYVNCLVYAGVLIAVLGMFTVPLSAAEHFRLPPDVTSAPSVATFRSRLKTFLFTESYPDIRLI